MKETDRKQEQIFTDTISMENKSTNPRDSIEFDLDKLIKFGVIERTISIGNVNFVLRTLTDDERDKIMNSFPNSSADQLDQIRLWRKPTLAAAIVKINNIDFSSPESKEKLLTLLGKMQSVILDKLFLEYLNMLNDQATMLESGSKKNS